MSENPSPEPEKAKADAAPKAASAPQGLAASGAQAYVPLPNRPAKGRGALALAALIAAGALAGSAYYYRTQQGPPPVVAAAAQENKILTVTDADLSVTATERVRKSAVPQALDSQGAAPQASDRQASAPQTSSPQTSAPQESAAPAPAAPIAPAESRASSPLPIVPPELISPAAAAPQSVLTSMGQQAVRSDGWSIFSMRLIDDVDQDGDVVQILVDGVPVSYLSLTHGGATLEIPLKKGESHRVTVLAVRDGVGGVTLGLQTSAGNVVSRRMLVGESDSWTIDYK